MNLLRLIWRCTAFFWVSMFYSIWGLSRKWMGAEHKAIYKIFIGWKDAVVRLLHIEVEIQGNVPDKPCLIMPNHRSYADVLLMPRNLPLVFVAKAEVQKYPIFGWGGDAMDTVWVNREDQNSRRNTRLQLKDRLSKGESIIIFPEGTTFEGPDILEFKPGMFFTAAEGGFPIVATAIEFEDSDLAFVNDHKLVPHLIRTFGKQHLRVKVRFNDPVTHNDGEELRQRVHSWVRKNVLELREEWDTELE